MKKENPIRSFLGLKQEEIAMLLGVSRARWGMYEIGKRDLPPSAMQLLAEMLSHVQPAYAAANDRHDSKQGARLQQQYELLLRQNKYQQLRLERQMAQTKKKQAAAVRLSLLADFLNNLEAKDGSLSTIGHQNILQKSHQTRTVNYEAMLVQQELKKEVLKFEKTLIESKMRNKDLEIK